jgi:(p)ppGpp synthase/HD superfamily hydrolase
MMQSYAQTNIQLFNQLQREGYSNAEISCIRNAYKTIMSLFAGCYRLSGKTFIAHLVGTASILSDLHAPIQVVAAGLMHAVYTYGDFGYGGTGINNAKRQYIRRAVGEEIEEYIAQYTSFSWNDQTIHTISDRFDELKQIERDVLLIRLANELEEHLDFGILYCGNLKYQQYITHNGYLMVDMAHKLGFPTLAIALDKLLKETAVAQIPVKLDDLLDRSSAFFIVPKSYKKRVSVVLHYLLSAIGIRIRSLTKNLFVKMKIKIT